MTSDVAEQSKNNVCDHINVTSPQPGQIDSPSSQDFLFCTRLGKTKGHVCTVKYRSQQRRGKATTFTKGDWKFVYLQGEIFSWEVDKCSNSLKLLLSTNFA